MPARRLRVYADTSVFGGVEDEEFAPASIRFFNLARDGKYLLIVSPLTLAELNNAPVEVRRIYGDLPRDCVEEVSMGADVDNLAQAYVSSGILQEAHRADATHVAAATVARADLILSWHFKHIVNYDKIQRFNGVNMLNGYSRIEIHSPLEITYDEDQSI